MPFGGVLFADREEGARPFRIPRMLVTSAFRRSAVRGLSRAAKVSGSGWFTRSPVPFGGVLFADLPAFRVRFARFRSVTSAFRRSAVRGRQAWFQLPGLLRASPVPFGGVLFADLLYAVGAFSDGHVTSAFRRSAVRGQLIRLQQLRAAAMSPVPFGGVLFADRNPQVGDTFETPSHQCLSAECCSRTQ